MLFGMNSTASLPEAVSSTSLLLWDPVYDNRLTTGSQEAPIALKSFAQNLKTVTGRQKGCKSGQRMRNRGSASRAALQFTQDDAW